MLGSQREGDQYGTLMAGYYSLISDREVLRGEAHLLMKEHKWSDYLEDTEVRESTKVYSILLGKRIRLSGGAEVTVYELVATAAGVELPNVKIGPDEANATLRRYGMKVRAGNPVSTGKWLIENNSHEVTRLLSDTPFAADWRGQLLRLDGAEK